MKKLTFFFACIFCAAISTAQVNLNNGLVLYMDFNGNANDISGNNNNGTVNGASLVQDKWGNPNGAYKFDGVNDFIQVPNSSTLNFPGNKFTFYALVNIQGFYYGTCHGNVILDKGNVDNIPGNYSLRFDDNAITNLQHCFIPIPDTLNQNFYIWKNNHATQSLYTPPIIKNKWYCVVAVCDSLESKIYVDGVLKATANSTGLVGTNMADLFIGRKNNSTYPYWFNGIIDELRMYNRELSTQEIDSLCNYTGPTTIINNYAAVQSYDSCTNSIQVDNATGFANGDTILMIQMKGAIIDTTNTAAFGDVLNYNGAGNYEENIISNIVGNTVTLQNSVLRNYSIPNGKVQIVSIPQFTNYTVNKTHTAMPWNGNKGGILAMNVTGTLTLNADIDVSGKGFRGGVPFISSIVNCNKTDYFYPNTQNEGGHKGEGIAEIQNSKIYGRGKLASGGGGGNSHNAGGGGGGNGGNGGLGGNQYNLTTCPGPYVANVGGLGGSSLSYSNLANKIFLGGGGGCGHANDQGVNNGGAGGGIIFVKSNNIIVNNSAKLISNGDDADYANPVQVGVNDDGGNGGGSGGTILLSNTSIASPFSIDIRGGDGSDAHTATTATGPGGGGSGGIFWYSQGAVPASITVNSQGGQNGVVPQVNNTPFGSQPGQAGQTLTGLTLPIANVPFQTFSVNASNDTTICNGQTAQLQASGALSYSWSPAATLSNAAIANPLATPAVPTSYVVTGMDARGCTDKDTVQVNVSNNIVVTAMASDDSICIGQSVTLTASGATTYSWSGGVTHGVPFTPTATASYVVTGTVAGGCVGLDTITIVVLPTPVVSITTSKDTICIGQSVILLASGANAYSWSGGITNGVAFTPSATATYTVIGANGSSCFDTASVQIVVVPVPNITVSSTADTVCDGKPFTFVANGASSYAWTGGVTNGVPFTPQLTNTYTVVGTDANGCTNSASYTVAVKKVIIQVAPNDPILCNGDSILLVATGAKTYLWSPGFSLSRPLRDSTWASPTNTTTYTVIGTDAKNCQGTTTVQVQVVDELKLTLEKSGDVDCDAVPIFLTAKGGFGNYTWSPGSAVNDSTRYNPVANIKKSTVFTVTSQLGSCNARESITVYFYNSSEDGFFTPNAFSPNGDGKNDCYRVRALATFDTYQFEIYNRWGQSVFQANSINSCWDGTFVGEEAPVGNYYFFLKATGKCGDVFRKGDIMLIR